MGIKYSVGQKVQQVVPAPVAGEVTEAIIIGSDVHYKVDTVDAEGNHSARYFGEDQIEAVE